jgi:hypothetical protein
MTEWDLLMEVSNLPVKKKKCLTSRRGWSERGLKENEGSVAGPVGTSNVGCDVPVGE